MPAILIDIESMPAKEKLDLISVLWDSMEARDCQIPEWQEIELRKRLEEHKANPTEGRPWSDVRRDVFGR